MLSHSVAQSRQVLVVVLEGVLCGITKTQHRYWQNFIIIIKAYKEVDFVTFI